MDEFKMPEDFNPEFKKTYEMNNNKFEVQVEYKGADKLHHIWFFALLVNGHVISGGPFRWNVFERELTAENVCNHLASYWGPSVQVTEAQKLPYNQQSQLDEIVEKCAAFMHGYFIAENQEHTDYDIIAKHISEEGEWSVLLRPNYMPTRLMEFFHEPGEDMVDVRSYTQDRRLSFII